MWRLKLVPFLKRHVFNLEHCFYAQLNNSINDEFYLTYSQNPIYNQGHTNWKCLQWHRSVVPMGSKLCCYLNTSIVKKIIMAKTGLLLCGFLLSHLLGNFLILIGPEAFNTYAYRLTSTPLIYVAEVILGAIFLTHLVMAVKLTIENKMARPEQYHMRRHTGRGATIASATMPYTGVLILAFVIWHIWSIKLGAEYTIVHSHVEMRDLYRLLIEYFAQPLNVFLYIAGMLVIGLHVSHGFWSAFQSFGFNHPKYNKTMRCISLLFALAIASGFSSLPIYCYFKGGAI